MRVQRRNRVYRKTSMWSSWRHVAAYVYLFICLFDFVAMPVYYESTHKSVGELQLITAVKPLDPIAQVEVIKTLNTHQRWEPLTLGENGLFHVAFGAILGVAAWTRGQEKSDRIRYGSDDTDDVDDDPIPESDSDEPPIPEPRAPKKPIR